MTQCALVDLGLSITNGGHTFICNQSRLPLCDKNNNTVELDKGTLIDAWDGVTRQEIKSALNNGIQHPNCESCWSE
jgi:hypothetical protein